MYHRVGGRWLSARGTSHVESINRRFEGILVGTNISPRLAQNLATDFFGRENWVAACKSQNAKLLPIFNPELLLEVNDQYRKLDAAKQEFGNLRRVQPYQMPPVTSHADCASFGFEWQPQAMVTVEDTQDTNTELSTVVDDDPEDLLLHMLGKYNHCKSNECIYCCNHILI